MSWIVPYYKFPKAPPEGWPRWVYVLMTVFCVWAYGTLGWVVYKLILTP